MFQCASVENCIMKLVFIAVETSNSNEERSLQILKMLRKVFHRGSRLMRAILVIKVPCLFNFIYILLVRVGAGVELIFIKRMRREFH